MWPPDRAPMPTLRRPRCRSQMAKEKYLMTECTRRVVPLPPRCVLYVVWMKERREMKTWTAKRKKAWLEEREWEERENGARNVGTQRRRQRKKTFFSVSISHSLQYNIYVVVLRMNPVDTGHCFPNVRLRTVSWFEEWIPRCLWLTAKGDAIWAPKWYINNILFVEIRSLNADIRYIREISSFNMLKTNKRLPYLCF